MVVCGIQGANKHNPHNKDAWPKVLKVPLREVNSAQASFVVGSV